MNQDAIMGTLGECQKKWKDKHKDDEKTINALIATWTDPELKRIAENILMEYSHITDPEDSVWERLTYFNYYVVIHLNITEIADKYIQDPEISDFEKLIQILKLNAIHLNTQRKVDRTLSVA